MSEEKLLKNKRERNSELDKRINEEKKIDRKDPRRFLQKTIEISERRLQRESAINKKIESMNTQQSLSIDNNKI